MKSVEIHRIFDTVIDKNSQAVAYGGCPAFLPEEKDMFLNQAMLEVISNKITGNNTSRIAFEGSPKRISDLQGLIATDEGMPITKNDSYVKNKFVSGNILDDTRWILIAAELIFDTNSTNCILLDHASANVFKQTYDNLGCWVPFPVITTELNKLIVYIDPKIISSSSKLLNITYIKYPKKIDNSDTSTDYNEVPDNVMYEVIDRAVVLALENIESRRTESKLQINNLSE